MAEWKKVLVSGSNIEVNQITATGNTDIQGTLSLPDFSDVSASLAAAVAGTATAGDGIFVTGNIVSVDSASLATDMAGGFITATNGTLNLADSVGTLSTSRFTGSFSGSFDGSINVVDTNNTASFQLVFREGTVGGFSTLYADQDNAKLRYNPGTNTLENTTLVGDVTGDLTGTATSASHVASAYDTVGVSNATISLTDMGGNTDQITVNNVVNSDTAIAVIVTADNETDGNFYITTAKFTGGQTVYAHSSFVFNPTSSRVSINPNTPSRELHFEANSFTGSFKGDVEGTATSATQITVTQRNGNLNEHQVLFSRTTGSDQGVYGDNGFKYIPTSNGLIVGSVTASFQGDLDGTAATASAVDVTAAIADEDYRITMVDAAGTTGETLYVDTGLLYNPDTNKLTVSGDTAIGGNGSVTGDLTVGGTLTAQEFRTEYLTQVVIAQSGSTKLGNTADDIHEITGSLLVSEDLSVGPNLFVSSSVVSAPGNVGSPIDTIVAFVPHGTPRTTAIHFDYKIGRDNGAWYRTGTVMAIGESNNSTSINYTDTSTNSPNTNDIVFSCDYDTGGIKLTVTNGTGATVNVVTFIKRF